MDKVNKELLLVVGAIAGVVCLGVFVGLAIAPHPAEAKPYYSTGDGHIIKVRVTFQNDCWHEIYARATPKNNLQVVLNKETIRNNDAPDNGPSEILHLSWNFKGSKMTDTSSTNEGRFRTYVTIELQEGLNGETITKYQAYDPSKKVYDFGTYFMHTNSDLCK